MSDVAVVGAGLVGLAVADALARRGASVVVYDRGEPASAASWAGAGMLAPYSEAVDGDFCGVAAQLGVASLAMYESFAADLAERSGVDPYFRRDGTLHVAFDEAERHAFAHAARTLGAAGVEAEVLDRGAAIAREPIVSAAVRAGFWIAAEAQVDNRRLGRALLEAVRRAGVQVEAGCGEIGVDADERRVRGIRTAHGYRPARAVVNAAGAWAAGLSGVPPGARVPVRPAKGQILALAVPARLACSLIWGPGVYLVPRSDGRLLVGATVEDAGFDVRVTAGGMRTLLDAALRTAPSLADFTVAETWAGIRPASADGLPFIGPTSVEGYYVAAGHFRNGILLAPLTAELIARSISGEPQLPLGAAVVPGERTDPASAPANHPA